MGDRGWTEKLPMVGVIVLNTGGYEFAEVLSFAVCATRSVLSTRSVIIGHSCYEFAEVSLLQLAGAWR